MRSPLSLLGGLTTSVVLSIGFAGLSLGSEAAMAQVVEASYPVDETGEVLWEDRWWAARVVRIEGDRHCITDVGWDRSGDECVGSERIRLGAEVETTDPTAASERMAAANHLNQQGIQQLQTSQYREALRSFEQALAIYRETGVRTAFPQESRNGEARALGNLGLAYFSLSEYQRAIDYHQQALPIYQAVGDRNGEAKALTNLGVAYLSLSEYQRAIDSYQQALPIFQAVGDRNGEARALGNLGLAYFSLSEYQRAIDSYQQALPIFQAVGDRNGEANTLTNLGNAYLSLSEYQRAIAYYQQALPIFQAVGDRNGEADALMNLGNAYLSLSEYQRAIAYYQQALPIFQAVGDRNGEAQALGNLGNAYLSLSEYQRAIAYYQQALPIFQAVGDRNGEAGALTNLGLAYRSLSEYQRAIDYYQQALPIFQAVGDRNGEASALNNLGGAYRSLSEYQRAIDSYQQALPIFQAVGDRNGEADALTGLGNAYRSLSEYQRAIDFYQQALPIYQAVGDRNGEANALGNLGVAYGSLSEYQREIDYYQQALPIFQAVGDRNGEAGALTNLGVAYRSLSEYQRAIDSYQQALPIFQAVGDRNGEARALTNLGNAYRSLSEYRSAIDSYQQALPIFQAVGDRNGEAAALMNLGNAYRSLSEYQRAIDYHQQALPILQAVGDRNGEAGVLMNLGVAYLFLSEYQRAIDSYQQALPIFQAVGDRAGAGILLANIGKLLEAQDQPELAIAFLKQSVNVRETIRVGIQGLDQSLQQSYTDSVADDYRRLADLLLRENRVLEAQRVLDLLKVQELDDYLRDVRGNAETASGVEYLQQEQDILSRYNALQQTAIELGQELAQLQQKANLESLTASDMARRDDLVRLQDELNQQFNNFARTPEIRSLIEQLDFDAREQTVSLGALDGLRDELDDLNAVLLYPLILENRIELIITIPNSPPLRRTVEGIGSEAINQAIVELRQALEDPRLDAVTPAQKLYRWLIEPLEADLAQAQPQTIIYAPDGQLRYIPLAALHDGEQWLAQRYAVNNITAASLQALTIEPPTTPRVLAGAFADPNAVHPKLVGDRNVEFRGLPFAGTEVQTLSETLPNTTTLIDQAFALAVVQPQMNNFNILHFATHAAFVSGDASQSFILFGDGDTATLRDIESWSLFNVDLVVLSACETGLGGFDNNGAQILGLGYQFQSRGVRATIASLWQVSDGGTQVLMNAFYAGLDQGMSKAAALQAAQRALISGDFSTVQGERSGDGTVEIVDLRTGLPPQVSSNLNHPYYWAPFILIGNGL
jgi:CHAT domain-containing protein/lipopolysaccharide biosynthesis regulator YciM